MKRSAIREALSLAELSRKYGVQPNMISGWKRAAIKNMASAFSKGGDDAAKASEAELDKLHSKIGQLSGGTRFFETCLGSLSTDRRQMCIEKGHPRLSIRRQCKLLSLVRSGLYYHPVMKRRKPALHDHHR